jgi:hypothetical protein
MKKIYELPAVLTSFAYREEYFPELDGMLATIREHHPDWIIVTGRGPLSGYNTPTLEVESPIGKCRWSLPIALDLDETNRDWLRINHMKAWWVAQVWHNLGSLLPSPYRRVIWFDADGRLNAPLDFEVEPESETVAGVWWTDPGIPEDQHHICGGLLMFQGVKSGTAQSILDQWAAEGLLSIVLPSRKSPYLSCPETDQCLLTTILKTALAANRSFTTRKLPYDKYCGLPDRKTGARKPGALVDQWMMGLKMHLPENKSLSWPPPEEQRRSRPEARQRVEENA